MPEFDLTGLFISDGISNGRNWGTYRRRRTGSLMRVHSRNRLPDRDTQEEAEDDLRKYLEEMATRGRSPLLRQAAQKALEEHGLIIEKEEGMAVNTDEIRRVAADPKIRQLYHEMGITHVDTESNTIHCDVDLMRQRRPRVAERSLVTGGNPDELYPVPPEEDFDGDFVAAPHLKQIADRLIESHMAKLGHLRLLRIAYLWKAKGGKSAGKETLGRCQRASQLVTYLANYDWIIWLAADHVRDAGLSRWQVEALLFHELLHVGVDEETCKPAVLPHDTEMFAAEIEEYGLWNSDLKFVGTAFQQLSMFDSPGMNVEEDAEHEQSTTQEPELAAEAPAEPEPEEQKPEICGYCAGYAIAWNKDPRPERMLAAGGILFSCEKHLELMKTRAEELAEGGTVQIVDLATMEDASQRCDYVVKNEGLPIPHMPG